MRFSMRDWLWGTLVVAMGLGWCLDHWWQADRYADLESRAYPDRDFDALKAAHDKLRESQ